jgi:DNA polymerase elongation subunit (family B)
MSEFYTSVLPYGSTILYLGYKDGERVKKKVDFKPSLYTSGHGTHKTLWGDSLREIKFDSIRACKEYLDDYEDVSNMEILGQRQLQYQYINKTFPDDIQYDFSSVRTYFIDIEVASESGFPSIEKANEEILVISVVNNRGEVFVFSSRHVHISDDNVTMHDFTNEREMLKSFVTWWNYNYPDVVTGWNTDKFDIPYLVHRITNIIGEDWAKKLSPWGQLRSKEIEDRGKRVTVWDIVGVNNLDYMDLYKKYTYSQQESWALNHIASIELGEQKHENKWGSFKDWYTKAFPEFVQYNINDAILVLRLEHKLKFIELVLAVAWMAKCNIRDVFSPVKTWDVFIYNFLSKQNIVIPNNQRHSSGEFAGAYVKDPVPGLYGWVMSFDFASLYPSIIRQWNISPETLISGGHNPISLEDIRLNEKEDEEYCLAANGSWYRNDITGFSPTIMKYIIDGRKAIRKQIFELKKQGNLSIEQSNLVASLNGKQMAFKILANSYYGATANVGFRYYNLTMAEAVTLTGQLSIQHVEKKINAYLSRVFGPMDYVITMDTDSCYLNVQPIVDKLMPGKSDEAILKFLYKVEEQLQKVINDSISEIYDYCNCHERALSMKRETIASKGLFTTKKRYALKMHDSEGVIYDPPKMKIMGLDIIKSSTPQLIRNYLKEALILIFEKSEEDLHKFVSDLKVKFFSTPAHEIAFPRSLTDMDKWADKKTIYRKGCPIHVRGALLHNELIKKVDREIQPIANGDKIKFIYLRLPNPIREDVISFVAHDTLPPEFGLDKYIDYELQWEKVFVNPLKGITDKIGWSVEYQPSLEMFFE